MSDKPQLGKGSVKRRALSAHYCPKCGEAVPADVRRCPSCGFTGADTVAMFPDPPPLMPVLDAAGLWNTGDLKAIEAAREKLRRRLPQFKFHIYTVMLSEEISVENPRLAPHVQVQTMIPRLLAIFALVWLGLDGARAAETDFEYGPRPANSVFDPNGVLVAATLGKITEPMQRLRKVESIDIVVAVLGDLKGAPPEHVAGSFAAAWSDSLPHAVVLHVPGREDSPWIITGGEFTELLQPESMARDLTRDKRLASYEPTDAGKVRVAVEEAADRLRYWKAAHFNATEARKNAIARMQLEDEDKSRQWRIVVLTSAACLIPLILLCYLLYRMLQRPGSRHFPDVVPPRRMGAPHAGGNHAVTKLGPPPP